MRIHENHGNHRKTTTSLTIYEHPCSTMKVLKRQEATLESGKGSFKGSKSYRFSNTRSLGFLKIYGNSRKVYVNIWKAKEIHEHRES